MHTKQESLKHGTGMKFQRPFVTLTVFANEVEEKSEFYLFLDKKKAFIPNLNCSTILKR